MEVTFDAAIDEANRLFREGKASEAARQCAAVLDQAPGHADANSLLGIIKLTRGEIDGAVKCFENAIESDPRSFDAHKNLGIALANMNRFRDAVASFQAAVAIKPDYAEAHYDLGVLYLDRSRLPEAIASLRKAIELKSDLAEAHFNLAVALGEQNNLEAAVASYQRVLELKPGFVEAHFNLGIVLGKLNRHSTAIANFQKVVEERPDLAEAHLNLGVALRMSGYGDAAIKSYRKALEINPEYAAAHNNLGIALASSDRLDDAVAAYRRAIEIDPEYAEAHFNLGMAMDVSRRSDSAIEHLRKAVTIMPDYVDAHKALAAALARMGRHRDAVDAFQKALNLGRADADVLTDLGQSLNALGRSELAITSFREALALKPGQIGAYHGLVGALTRLKRYQEAIASCDAALAIQPSDTIALDMLADLCRHVCAWQNIEATTRKLIEIVNAKWGDVSPFWFLAIADDPAAQLSCAQQYWRGQKIPTAPAWRPSGADQGKLRVGYVSRDLNLHATAYLMSELFELHDRSRFEVLAFSYGRDDQSPMRARVAKAVDGFFDLQNESDNAVAGRIRSEKVDILVDLDGHTRRNRLAVLARRPAPVQVHYLGYPGSLGVDFIDYILVDRFVVPPDQQEHFSERLVHLPDSYQVSDRKRVVAERTPSRQECGLPDDGFVFCCFNNTYKITPPVFDVWMRLLRAAPKSVLWLLSDIDLTKDNLRREAAARGVDATRLVFASNAPTPFHLARHRLADLFLDTSPYNAHTTANDALWLGLPVLTCAGRAFAARVAGSLLHAVGLPELITNDLGAYERLAGRLAQDGAALAAIRQKLAHNIATAPLFDIDRTRKNIEAAYLRMWDIKRRGESPRSFAVD